MFFDKGQPTRKTSYSPNQKQEWEHIKYEQEWS